MRFLKTIQQVIEETLNLVNLVVVVTSTVRRWVVVCEMPKGQQHQESVTWHHVENDNK